MNLKRFKRLDLDGYKSRKLWFSVGAIGSAFAFAFLAGWKFPAMIPMFSEFNTTLIAITGIFIGGNIGNKYVYAKHADKIPQNEPEPPPKQT